MHIQEISHDTSDDHRKTQISLLLSRQTFVMQMHGNFGDKNKALKSNKMSNNLIALLMLSSITESRCNVKNIRVKTRRFYAHIRVC